MKTNTRENILEYIGQNNPVTINDIVSFFGLSRQIIHRHLKKLSQEGKIYKTGEPPKVYYFLKELEDTNFLIKTKKENLIGTNKIIAENFVYFGADGTLKYGIEGFNLWCKKRNLDIFKESEIYVKTFEKYNKYKNKFGLINGKEKMENTFQKVYLDEIYYLDFYSIEKYGKTILGNLMFYGKQTGKKDLANKIIELIKNPIYELIKHKKIDSFAFIPPSIDRKVQLMDLLKDGLSLNLRELKTVKIFKDTPVPQKSLSKKEDRIINARDTIYVLDRNFRSETLLLIDDAIGSGATLNETAKKIKELGLSKRVLGFAIVGSFKGFEVINEV